MTVREESPIALDAAVIEHHQPYAWLPKLRGRIVCVAHDWVIVQWDDGLRERVPRTFIGHDESAYIELMPDE
jgi:hypothetical protein